MKVKYGKGGSSDEMMYAKAGALITGLAKNKDMRDAMKAELAKYEEGGSVTGGDKGQKGKRGKNHPQNQTYRADSKPADGVTDEMLLDFKMQQAERYVDRTMGNAAIDRNAMITAFATRDPSGLSDAEKSLYQKNKGYYVSEEYGKLHDRGVLVTQYVDKKTGQPASEELLKAMERQGFGFTYDPEDSTHKTYIIAKKR